MSLSVHHFPASRLLGRATCRAGGFGLLASAVFALSALAAAGSPHEGVRDHFGHSAPATREAPHSASSRNLPPLGEEFARFEPHRFFEDRQDLNGALYDLREGAEDETRPTSAEIDLLLDLAALHLSQRLLPEALSFLDSLAEGGQTHSRLSPAQAGRRGALQAAVSGFAATPAPAPEEWDDAPLFTALHHIARAEHARARPFLGRAEALLRTYPPALADAALPSLLWAAIEGGSWDMARALAAQLEAADGTGQSPAYRYLLGRAAEIGGDLVAAFDNHAAAAAGTDEWAQRARIALIDLGRSTGTLPPEEARELLTQARTLWAGGELGLANLQRLAGLELAERRTLPALAALAEIIRLHPETQEAATARAQARALMDAIYSRGLANGMPLAEFLTAHRALERDYRHFEGFDVHAEALADHLAATGASDLAATEYGKIIARISARETVLADDPRRDFADLTAGALARDRLRLKQTGALVQGGRAGETGALLEGGISVADPAMREQFNLMRAELFAATARPAEVLATRMDAPSDAYLRLRAQAAAELGYWPEARDSYEMLYRRLGARMETRDRLNLMLAAYRMGDSARLRELSASFPDVSANWGELITNLTQAPPDVMPLRDTSARARLDSADAVLRHLQAAVKAAEP